MRPLKRMFIIMKINCYFFTVFAEENLFIISVELCCEGWWNNFGIFVEMKFKKIEPNNAFGQWFSNFIVGPEGAVSRKIRVSENCWFFLISCLKFQTNCRKEWLYLRKVQKNLSIRFIQNTENHVYKFYTNFISFVWKL